MTASRRGGRGPRAGVTFIERPGVGTIIAIMFGGGISISALFGVESNLSAAATGYSRAVEMTRLDAITNGRVTWMQIDLGDSDAATQYYRAVIEPEPGHENDRLQQDDDPALHLIEW